MAKYNFKRKPLCQSILAAIVLSSLVPVQAKRFGFQSVVNGIQQGAGVIRNIRSAVPAGGSGGSSGGHSESSSVSGTVLPSTPTPTPTPPTPSPTPGPDTSTNSSPSGNGIFHNYGTEGSRHAYNSGGGATATVVVVNEKVAGRNVHGHPVTRVVSRGGGQHKTLSSNDTRSQPQPVEPQQHIDPNPTPVVPPIAKTPTLKNDPETGWVDKMMTNMTLKLQKG